MEVLLLSLIGLIIFVAGLVVVGDKRCHLCGVKLGDDSVQINSKGDRVCADCSKLK